jgi:predicted AlkP superfamily pyrophosphatase or phosphodiesterase
MRQPSMRHLMALVLLCSVVPPVLARPARLGVLVVFDQVPSWLMDRQPSTPNGLSFGGLRAAHIDVDYPYAGTETAPGHATLATGASPAVHGIAANSWAVDGQLTYVVDDPATPVLLHPKAGKSPRWLMAPTLADAMKRNSDGRAKVLTISHKDRAAILTAGRSADLAVWYEPDLGRYTSSRAYVDALPAWLMELGQRLPAQAMAEGTWSPLPGLRSRGGAPIDDRVGEGAFSGVGKTFPHNLRDMPAEARAKAYRMTPQSMVDLFVLARAGVEAMGLGTDDEPDLLVVSVSTTDYIGHNFGGDSLEQADLLARADAELRSFVGYLEKRVGRDQLVVAVTSDHGAPQLPQAGRPWDQVVTYESVAKAAEGAAQLVAPSKTARVAAFWPPQLALNLNDLDTNKQHKVLMAVEAAVEQVSGVAQVYRMDSADEDSFVPLMRNMAYPGRSAQLFVRQSPRAVFLEEKSVGAGTDHGSVYSYDRRVPFLLQASGVRVGRLPIQADVRDVVSTLAWAMGVDAPDAAQGHVLSAMFKP